VLFRAADDDDDDDVWQHSHNFQAVKDIFIFALYC